MLNQRLVFIGFNHPGSDCVWDQDLNLLCNLFQVDSDNDQSFVYGNQISFLVFPRQSDSYYRKWNN